MVGWGIHQKLDKVADGKGSYLLGMSERWGWYTRTRDHGWVVYALFSCVHIFCLNHPSHIWKLFCAGAHECMLMQFMHPSSLINRGPPSLVFKCRRAGVSWFDSRWQRCTFSFCFSFFAYIEDTELDSLKTMAWATRERINHRPEAQCLALIAADVHVLSWTWESKYSLCWSCSVWIFCPQPWTLLSLLSGFVVFQNKNLIRWSTVGAETTIGKQLQKEKRFGAQKFLPFLLRKAFALAISLRYRLIYHCTWLGKRKVKKGKNRLNWSITIPTTTHHSSIFLITRTDLPRNPVHAIALSPQPRLSSVRFCFIILVPVSMLCMSVGWAVERRLWRKALLHNNYWVGLEPRPLRVP